MPKARHGPIVVIDGRVRHRRRDSPACEPIQHLLCDVFSHNL